MQSLVVALFWLSAAVVAYAYLGYPLLLMCLTRRSRQSGTTGHEPSVDLLIAAYNEAREIAAKLENSLALDYTAGRLTITVVTDGSTDATPDIVRGYAGQGVRLMHQPERRGKAAALTRALPELSGEVVLFSDANCALAPSTVRMMVRHLEDPRVGGVSGAKRVVRDGRDTGGEGVYWRYETWLKGLDNRFGSVMGAPGEVWAARREAYRPPPEDIVLDDFYASLDMVARGWRVAFEPEAIASEAPSPTLGSEWQRRVRNAAGGWQAVALLRGVWQAGARTVFQYLSHRVLRWIVVPPLLVLLPLLTLALLPHPFYAVILIAQVLFALAAFAGWALDRTGRQAGPLAAPLHVVMLNAAALVGGLRYLRGEHSVLWAKVRP